MKILNGLPVGLQQLIRYGIVGLTTSIIGYSIYLLITWAGVDPKLTVTLTYPVGIAISYMGQSKYAFSDKRSGKKTMAKFLIAHILGYLLNVLLLFILCDELNFPHQAVQALAIFIVAGFLFTLMRYFVFNRQRKEAMNE